MPIVRVTTFIAGTPILSAEVNAELDQIVELLSGLDDATGIEIALDDPGLSPIVANQKNSGGPIFEGQKNGVTAVYLDEEGQLQIPTNTAFSDFATAMGVMDSNPTQVGAGTTEANVYSMAVSANTLTVDGDFLHFTVSGTLSGATNKIVRVYYGTTSSETKVFDSSDTVADLTGVYWSLDVYIVRDGSTSARCLVRFTTDNGVGDRTTQVAATVTSYTSGTTTFKVTGQGSASSSVTKMIAIAVKGNER